MTDYDLKSLELPKLYGIPLSIFADALDNPLTRPLLIGNLLEAGGIPRLKHMVFDEAPTLYPLKVVEERARAGMDMPAPEVVKDWPRTYTPFRTVRDYYLAYTSGKSTPAEVAEKIQENINSSSKGEIRLNAFVELNRDDLFSQARASTERILSGNALSVLDGVPVAVKDEVDQTPFHTNVGTNFMGKKPAAEDSTVVARLRAAGALLIGKTTMHEIGINPNGSNLHYGRVANPYDLHRDTGGSSSGSAAAVAAGFCPVAIGADGGGSIRIPAALCGCVGLKPTFGRVSERGAAPLCHSVAHLGPIGATVEDVMLIYAAIAGPDVQDPNSQFQSPVTIEGWDNADLKGLRAGVYLDWFRHAAPEVVNANEAMLRKLFKAGLEIKEIVVPELDAMRIAHAVTILCEMAACVRKYSGNWKDFSPSTRASLVLGEVIDSYTYLQAQKMRTRALNIFMELFKGVDVIVTPATALPAPIVPKAALSKGWSDLSIDTEMMRYIYPANLTGLPAISFPVGYTREGMPIGMHVMGRHWEENLLLRVAYAAEQLVERKLPKNYYQAL